MMRPCQMAAEDPKGILSSCFYMKCSGIIPLGLEGESTMVERDTSRVNVSCRNRGSLQT